LQYVLVFAAVSLGHLTLLHLPYYWDEGGYYVPAALDFLRRGTLIPSFTNAHPPLPNVVLGMVWHVTGFYILPTRLVAAAFAAAGLLAAFRLALHLLNATAALAVLLLTAVYPIWYAQSTLAHADIFAAAFTLAALTLYLPEKAACTVRTRAGTAILLSLAALSKETAIVWPALLALVEFSRFLRSRQPQQRRAHGWWFLSLCTPVLPLLAWYAYHRHKTGFTFGNPEFLRYNATANFTAAHVLLALQYRAMHLFTQRNMWLPLLLALACSLLTRAKDRPFPLPRSLCVTLSVLVLGNWLFFSVLGGALLTRYLLPVYPLLLFVAVAVWQNRTAYWPVLAVVTAAVFISAWWINPSTSFALEDCLSYRDMIVVHQQAIAYIDQHVPQGTVLTAWPATTELFDLDLGYTDRPVKVVQMEDFTAPEIEKAARETGRYDTALVFTMHFVKPSLRHWLQTHPETGRARQYNSERDRTPEEVAKRLGGTIVFEAERHGEDAAVLRFPRANRAVLDASLHHVSFR
jgi:4-amino-4-deoxy-L-arabinose transferase-like glycosyltransferase